ncbi:intraflagellar transport protein 20 homolog [Chelonus insularis]|uniref:intraflagellar transport protein 20 homolog n=1 Tax=Chelonus insularis TaxID=460826 RepID=UPI00158E429A|nr:intraflagellar transport protein 20 homolog [Chelonus insularis]
MADSLAKYGLYVDDLCKLRILEPEVTTQSEKLSVECQDFVSKITDFKKNADFFIETLDKLAAEVEKEKMRTIGARNLLSSVEKQRDAQKQKIQAMIIEKTMELERLRVQYDSLKKIESEQLETIEHLMIN